MNKRLLTIGVILITTSFLLATNAFSAVYYTCVIERLITTSDGTVRIIVSPGTGETSFSGEAKVDINPNNPGAKNLYANALTAFSMGVEIKVLLDYPPEATPQYLRGFMTLSQ